MHSYCFMALDEEDKKVTSECIMCQATPDVTPGRFRMMCQWGCAHCRCPLCPTFGNYSKWVICMSCHTNIDIDGTSSAVQPVPRRARRPTHKMLQMDATAAV